MPGWVSRTQIHRVDGALAQAVNGEVFLAVLQRVKFVGALGLLLLVLRVCLASLLVVVVLVVVRVVLIRVVARSRVT